MAKGNLFLGTAAKSVGDVVMYRREGSQVSRVRVRKIANPKTDAQCKQRAIMAPIPKFFSPLAIVLERSFEGLSKSKSYSKFLKTNADKARANDWLLPKGTGFFPLPYELSKGTLPVVEYGFNNPASSLGVAVNGIDATPTTIGELSEAFVGLGYNEGDIVTVLLALGTITESKNTSYPITFQFAVDTASTDTIATALSGLVLNYGAGYLTFAASNGTPIAGAIIVARWENDKWRRSSQALAVKSDVLNIISADAYKAAAIASYKGTATDGNPLVYLDGDELQ